MAGFYGKRMKGGSKKSRSKKGSMKGKQTGSFKGLRRGKKGY